MTRFKKNFINSFKTYPLNRWGKT